MPTISRPDPLFRQVESSAKASGMSLDAWVADKLSQHLEGELPPLTDERWEKVRQGQEEIRNGKGIGMAQLEERLAETRNQFMVPNRT
ncbi:hypothetical protein EON81_20090 [bacterium]|nr:MAG: hypothetical protein EON81_20090 [bacterium]